MGLKVLCRRCNDVVDSGMETRVRGVGAGHLIECPRCGATGTALISSFDPASILVDGDFYLGDD